VLEPALVVTGHAGPHLSGAVVAPDVLEIEGGSITVTPAGDADGGLVAGARLPCVCRYAAEGGAAFPKKTTHVLEVPVKGILAEGGAVACAAHRVGWVIYLGDKR